MELRGERIILWNDTSKVALSLNRKGEEKRWIVTAFNLKKRSFASLLLYP